MFSKRSLGGVAFAIVAGLASGASAPAGGGPYRFDATVIAGGGGTASGGSFTLSGTFGQPAAASLTAAPYAMHDGFWGTAASSQQDDAIFANGFDP